MFFLRTKKSLTVKKYILKKRTHILEKKEIFGVDKMEKNFFCDIFTFKAT
jgi:hypothetical protein